MKGVRLVGRGGLAEITWYHICKFYGRTVTDLLNGNERAREENTYTMQVIAQVMLEHDPVSLVLQPVVRGNCW
jgi:hypothetical protein